MNNKRKKEMKMRDIVIGMVAMLLSASALADNPKISGVIVQQRWPWSRLVDIDYLLTCHPEVLMDITVSAFNGSEPLDMPEASLSGDVAGVKRGARRIVWDPAKTAMMNNDGFLPDFRVELTPSLTPLYMIVDLNKSAGAAGQTEYVYEADLTNGVWGAWVRNPVTNDGAVVESVVWTGLITNEVYKTDKIVLRWIPAGTFTMGVSKVDVTLSRGFYAGVYQVTQAQWEKIMGENPSSHKVPSCPVERVSYNSIRGAEDDVPAIDWPATGASVLSSSFVGLLRTQTGLSGFDLPTEAQWEYACRAGTTTRYSDGIKNATTNQLNKLGWWEGNSGGETHPVGLKTPNAWGLYDMHGNVREWCLDYFDELVGGTDPVGAAAAASRVLRNGGARQPESYCPSYYRWRDPSTYKANNLGFRLVITHHNAFVAPVSSAAEGN